MNHDTVASDDEERVAAKDLAIGRAQRLESLPLQQVGPKGGFWTGPVRAVFEVFRHRELLDLLIRRELKARYKDSIFGFLWTLARPLTQLLIYYLVLGQFLGAARGIENFAIFIFAGLTAYGLFSEVLMTMTSTMVVNGGLIKKVYLPREIFPMASVGSSLFNFGIQLVILIIAALAFGQLVPGFHLLYFLASLAIILVYGMAAGLALAAVNVYVRDMQYVVEIVVMLLMWFSPIVYSWTFVGTGLDSLGLPGWIAEVYLHTPLTLAVLGFQVAFWWPSSGGNFPADLGTSMLIAFVIGIVLLWLAQRLFARLEGNFAQEL
ncbi:MAG: ABC transporter permease [Pseudoclavibacter sp.]